MSRYTSSVNDEVGLGQLLTELHILPHLLPHFELEVAQVRCHIDQSTFHQSRVWP